MKEIISLNSLHDALKANGKAWLLLYKKGAPQSDCALEHFKQVAREITELPLYFADVNTARDIHSEYGIDSVPTLLKFEKSKIKKIVKGCHKPEQFEAFIYERTVAAYSATGNKPMHSVVVYTTPTCSWCTAIKRHLEANQIAFREINVAADARAAETMVKKSGQQGVPQIEIDGNIVVGFDKTKINSLLGIN